MELKDCPYCGSSNVNDTTKPEGDPTLSMGCWNARDNTELEHCCKMLIGAGISTGHAGTFTELVEELMLNVVEALKSPWISCDGSLPEKYAQVFVAYDDGHNFGHDFVDSAGKWYMGDAEGFKDLHFGDGYAGKGKITHWQPISEIPK